jgi:CRP-like cAMP-binding protein
MLQKENSTYEIPPDSPDDRSSQPNNGSGSHNNRVPTEPQTLFSGVLVRDYAEICAASRDKAFVRGEMLYNAGQSVRQVILLTAGSVKITQLGMSGTEAILRFGIRGEVLGAMDLFSRDRHATTAQAFRPSRALVWEAPVFKSLVERHPVLSLNLIRMAGGHLAELGERFCEVATEKVSARVARQILRLQEQIGRPVNGEVELELSREDVAQMTGTTLFTVSRLFSAWSALGMIKPRRAGVTVCDVASLRAVSEEG